jgi:hypothetical protein
LADAGVLIELARPPQLLGDRYGIDGLAAAVQAVRGFEDRAVRRLVEVARLELRFDRGGDRLATQHHRPEERLFGLDVVRGYARPVRSASRVLDRDHRRYLPPRRDGTMARNGCGVEEDKPVNCGG